MISLTRSISITFDIHSVLKGNEPIILHFRELYNNSIRVIFIRISGVSEFSLKIYPDLRIATDAHTDTFLKTGCKLHFSQRTAARV